MQKLTLILLKTITTAKFPVTPVKVGFVKYKIYVQARVKQTYKIAKWRNNGFFQRKVVFGTLGSSWGKGIIK